MAKERKETLSSEDAGDFFRLFFPLLAYVNQAYEISDGLDEQIGTEHLDLKELKKVVNKLWADPSIIDNYMEHVREQIGLDKEDQKLLEGWKHPLTGKFVLERHLSRGSIFIDLETEKVYLVKGLTNTWRELLQDAPLPLLMKATLIPFRGNIISDGLIVPNRVSFGLGYREGFRQIYMKAKQDGAILTAFPVEDTDCQIK